MTSDKANKSKKAYWKVGDIVKINNSRNLKVTETKQDEHGRCLYYLEKVDNAKIRYIYSFGGGLYRVY